MIRVLPIAAAALLLLGAAKPESVDYRLGVEPLAGQPALLTVQIRFRGDADGETTLDLPDSFASGKDAWRHISDLRIQGASVTAPDPAHRVLRHRPGARITVRYRVQTAYPQDPQGIDGNPYRGPLIRPDWFAALGEFVFAVPAGRESQAAGFAWDRLPRGWRAASDLDHGRMGRFISVADVRESVSLGGTRLAVLEVPVRRGALRVATFEGSHFAAPAVADETARILMAERAYWKDDDDPYFVALIPLAQTPNNVSIGGTGRGDAFALYATTGAPESLRWTLAHELTHTWISARVGRLPAKDEPAYYWLSEGFTDFFTLRALVRAGQMSPEAAVDRLAATLKAYDASPVRTAPAARVVADFWTDRKVRDLPYQKGALLALKWDEDIRRKTGGKADLDDVILRMRDHYRQFPAGQGPDIVTGLVSAAWVTAQLDLRPDIARHAMGGAPIVLPETMFDGCLEARVTVSPGFDSGFDHAGSFAAKTVRGVRRGGPAWNSGLRNGMTLDAWTFKAGDMAREIELTVRPQGRRAKPRKLRYWPYGDADVETRTLGFGMDLTREAQDACGRRLGGA